MKSEPDAYSIDDLARDGVTPWSGVRNHLARNYMRDHMQVGDAVLFYHSNAEPSGVAGVGRVASAAYPDPTQFDLESDYFDPKASAENPTWRLVDVAFVAKFPAVVALAALKNHPATADLLVCRKGQRLSILPVEPAHFTIVEAWGRTGVEPE
ncbi:MAG: EVE domain-containing protein [Planctomycetia bacterium]